MDSQEESQPSQDSLMTIIDEERHEVLYFAYGSNMCTSQMRSRCPFSTAIGLGFLPHFRWIINERGFANVVPCSSSSSLSAGVYGLLYLVPPRDEESLDVFEGVPSAYEKMQCQVRWVRDGEGNVMPEGEAQTVKALVYVDEKRTGDGVPRDEYVGRMESGIEDVVRNWGMEEEYANRVMRKWWKTTTTTTTTTTEETTSKT